MMRSSRYLWRGLARNWTASRQGLAYRCSNDEPDLAFADPDDTTKMSCFSFTSPYKRFAAST
jgi:hypothetical protein